MGWVKTAYSHQLVAHSPPNAHKGWGSWVKGPVVRSGAQLGSPMWWQNPDPRPWVPPSHHRGVRVDTSPGTRARLLVPEL